LPACGTGACLSACFVADDQLLVVASDGVWEYMTNEEVLGVAGSCDSADLAARRLVDAAEARWREIDGGGYVDDITAVVVRACPRPAITTSSAAS
jgi:serine/threonine protein phosphatase PrpC